MDAFLKANASLKKKIHFFNQENQSKEIGETRPIGKNIKRTTETIKIVSQKIQRNTPQEGFPTIQLQCRETK